MTSFLSIDQALVSYEKNPTEAHAKAFRALIRTAIETELELGSDSNLSLAEMLDLIPTKASHTSSRHFSVVLLRAHCLGGALPPSSAENRLSPKLVDLLQRTVPDLLKKFGVVEREQSYEKLKKLEDADKKFREKLEILAVERHTLNAFSSARQQIQQTIGDNSLATYFAPYGFNELRDQIADILGQISALIQTGDDEVRQAINEVSYKVSYELSRLTDKNDTTLTSYHRKFLVNLENLLVQKKSTLTSQFACFLEALFSETQGLEKRYPLQTLVFSNPIMSLNEVFHRSARVAREAC